MTAPPPTHSPSCRHPPVLQIDQTKLQFPYPLAQVYGNGQNWAFGGTWIT